MHEVVWSRQLVVLLGAETYAQAVVLAVFMGGLAAGAVVLGGRADRGRPLALYMTLELLVAAYALLLPLLIWAAGAVYVAAARRFFDADGVRLLLRLILATLVVAPPAVMMGGTLPVLARRLARDTGEVRRRVGALYAVNSAGAVLGTAIAGFVALPLLGLWAALAVGAAANVAAALIVLPLAREERRAELPAVATSQTVEVEPSAPAAPPVQRAVLVGALFLSGFCAMGYEVLFVRVVGLAFGSSTYSFTVMLICFIAGIALGSALAGRTRWRAPLFLVGASQLAVVAAFAAATPLLARLPYFVARLRIALEGVPAGFELLQVAAAGLCLMVLLIPTLCLGFPFPLVAQARADRAGEIGGRVGNTYAFGTVGNVLGVLFTTLVVLPRLGLERGFHLLWAVNLVAGLALLLVTGRRGGLRRLVVAGAALAMLAAYAAGGRGWSRTLTLVPDHLLLRKGPQASDSPAERAEHPATSFAAWRKRYLLTESTPPLKVLEVKEDAHTTAVAFGGQAMTEGGMALAVSNKTDASTVSDLDTQMLLAHAPLFLARRTSQVLVIGLGAGITAGSALVHPVDDAEIVEISPAVIAVNHLFANDNHHVLSDQRVQVRVDDGQSFLRVVPRRYDVIISEPSNPWMAGVGNLFTREFFAAVRARLNPGGVFAFWFHTYAQTDDTTGMLLRTLGTVFPAAELFTDDYGDVVAVASEAAVEPDFAAMERRWESMPVRRDLKRLAMPSLAAFLTRHRLSQRGPESLAGPGPINTVAREQLQYRGPRALFAGWDSFFVEERDPYIRPGADLSATLYGRYLRWREARGRPMTADEVEAVATFVARDSASSKAAARKIRELSPTKN
jgi:spermidine synthase